ncbi:MAG TPA: VCBS repeat-containing protein [Polyangia bacterium]|nr:VCBS repeat-containing protein [Polyangia bacterium]
MSFTVRWLVSATALALLSSGCGNGAKGSTADMAVGSSDDMDNAESDLGGTDTDGATGSGDMSMDMKQAHPPLSFATPTTLMTTEAIPRKVWTGDFDANGKIDLLVQDGSIIASSTGGDVDALAGVGDGSFAYQAGHAFTVAKGGYANVFDVNNDGKTDGVYYYTTTNPISHMTSYFFGFATSNGDGTFTGGSFSPAPTSFGKGLYVGDLNNDHAVEVFTVKTDNSSNPLGFSLFMNDGANTMTRTDFVSPTYPVPTSDLIIRDLNGDGKADVFYAAQNQAVLVTGDGTGTLSGTPTTFSTGIGNNLSVAVADLNADGKPDLIVGQTSAHVAVILSQATGGFLAPNDVTGVGDANFVDVGDFDGDGLPDLVTCDGDNLHFLVNLGNGFAAPTTIAQTCGSIAVADFNGDHLADVATVAPAPSAAVLINSTH